MNAKWKYDADGFGVNAGTLSPVTLVTWSSQNISTTFGMAKAGLTNIWVNADKLVLWIDSFTTVSLTTLWLENNGAKTADYSYERWFRWMFGGMPTYEVSTLYWSTTLDLATNPTANDYVYIQWVKFTFVATPTNPWDVDIGSDADESAQNLVAAVNGAAWAWTTYIEVDEDDRARLEWVTATDGVDLVTFVSKGWALVASSWMTAAANDFQAQVINCVIMERWAIKMALRNSVKVKTTQEPKSLVTNYFIYARYWLKVTTRSKEKMVLIPIVSKAAES
jgi:hypothetical protein